jgi:hypothetical protein
MFRFCLSGGSQDTANSPLLRQGGQWPLDHDDGSRFIIDRYNVVVYGGTKNYHGYEKQYYGNLFIRPDIGCGNVFCGENDASGVEAPKILAERWFNNTCITAGTPYKGACDAPDANSSTSMQYARNVFLTPTGDPQQLLVTCTGAGPPPPSPPPAKCAPSKSQCTAAWHCRTCKATASNPTDCLSCQAGYTFTREYSDCTGECTKPQPGVGEEPLRSLTFVEWQRAGWDRGSSVGKWPSPTDIVTMAKSLLLEP